MKKYEEKLLEAIDEIVVQRIKQHTNYNRTIKGVIQSQIPATDLYEVVHGGEVYHAKAINNASYLVGDVVYILILNDNFKDKIILCLVP